MYKVQRINASYCNDVKYLIGAACQRKVLFQVWNSPWCQHGLQSWRVWHLCAKGTITAVTFWSVVQTRWWLYDMRKYTPFNQKFRKYQAIFACFHHTEAVNINLVHCAFFFLSGKYQQVWCWLHYIYLLFRAWLNDFAADVGGETPKSLFLTGMVCVCVCV